MYKNLKNLNLKNNQKEKRTVNPKPLKYNNKINKPQHRLIIKLKLKQSKHKTNLPQSKINQFKIKTLKPNK